jgi:hypothetical protein
MDRGHAVSANNSDSQRSAAGGPETVGGSGAGAEAVVHVAVGLRVEAVVGLW